MTDNFEKLFHGTCHDCNKEMVIRWDKNWPVDRRPSWVFLEGQYIKVCAECFDEKYRAFYMHLGG